MRKKSLFHKAFLHCAKLCRKKFVDAIIFRIASGGVRDARGARQCFHRRIYSSLSGVAVFCIVL